MKFSLSKDGDKNVSPRLKVKEFRSHCNGVVTTDEVIVEDGFPAKLEAFADRLGAKYMIFSSAYRDSKCDKMVGGSGSGTHCEGKAVDVCFKYADGRVVDPRLVCILAQDTFGGVARIGDNYTHIDTRTGKKYLGDEKVSYKSVTTDFKEYFGRDMLKKKGFADETIDFLKTYKYSNDLFYKILR